MVGGGVCLRDGGCVWVLGEPLGSQVAAEDAGADDEQVVGVEFAGCGGGGLHGAHGSGEEQVPPGGSAGVMPWLRIAGWQMVRCNGKRWQQGHARVEAWGADR